MAQVVLELHHKTLEEKINLANELVTNMTGDPDYAAPDPSLATLGGAATDADNKKAAALVAKTAYTDAINQQDNAEKTLDEMLIKEGNYIQTASGGDKTKIEKTGAKTQAKGSASPLPPKVEGVSVSQGDNEFEIDIHWDRIGKQYNLKHYQIRYAVGEPIADNWRTYEKTTGKSKITFVAEALGTRIWFEVRAVNATGEGAYSLMVSIIPVAH